MAYTLPQIDAMRDAIYERECAKSLTFGGLEVAERVERYLRTYMQADLDAESVISQCKEIENFWREKHGLKDFQVNVLRA